MPSPFPGMDPYLEERSLWPDMHSSLISYIREALQPQLRPKYIARIGERVELTTLGKDNLLNSQANSVEIDLLSGQTSTLARAFEINSPSDWRYIITTSRPHRF